MDITTGRRTRRPAAGPGSAAAAGPADCSSSAEAAGLPARSPRLAVGLIAVAAAGLELAVSARYGYVRDELYFLAAGHHPAFGYVDQPPLTPLLAWFSATLTGNTVVGLRVLPALALAAMVLLTAAISRQLGAGRTGQVLAALTAAACTEYAGAMHELTTTTPDFVFWAATLLLTVRLLTSRDPRWWLAIGACVGVASEAKWNIGFLAAALVAALLVSDQRRLLRSRWLVAGGLLAAGLAAPDIIWQAAHGWPQLAVFHALQGSAWHNRATFWPAQILFTGPALIPVWASGLIWSLRSQAARPVRPVAVACAAVIILQFVLGGKPYYPGGAYAFLLAAGAVALERRLAARHRSAAGVTAAILAGAAIALPVALPVLPPGTLHTVPLQKINYDLGEEIGWPREVALVAGVYGSLPGRVRRTTAIITANYGEAGAIDRYGPGLGLPQAYSGANSFWLWGPPPAGDRTAVVVGLDPALLRREFTSVRRVATFWNGLGVSDDEQGMPVFLATGLRTPWRQVWPAFRDYA